jgi:hypothetical protein
MSGVYFNIISNFGASHMNATATLSKGRTAKENGDGMVCKHFLGPFI